MAAKLLAELGVWNSRRSAPWFRLTVLLRAQESLYAQRPAKPQLHADPGRRRCGAAS